jgi:hypothetical protein
MVGGFGETEVAERDSVDMAIWLCFEACDEAGLWGIVVVEWRERLLWQRVILLLRGGISCLLLARRQLMTLR